MSGKTVLLKPFKGEKDVDRNFDILRSLIISKKLEKRGKINASQRSNLLRYTRTNYLAISELRRKYPIINDEIVKKIANENNCRFNFWSQENTRTQFKLITSFGKKGTEINLKISGFETFHEISYRNMMLILDLHHKKPFNSANKRLKCFPSISHAVNHFCKTKFSEEEFFNLWGDYEIRFRQEEQFIEIFGIGLSFWRDDGHFRRLRASWSENHIPILISVEKYKKLKMSIYEEITVVIDKNVLKDFRCQHCSSHFSTKQHLKEHEKICQLDTSYHYTEKQYGDVKSVRQILIDEGIVPENDESYKNFVAFDIECLSVPISLK